jgi:hypothetical protein
MRHGYIISGLHELLLDTFTECSENLLLDTFTECLEN